MSQQPIPEYKPSFLAQTFPIPAVYSIHYFKYNKGFSFEGERHDFWELVYIDAGRVCAVADETTHELTGGQVIFHKPGEFHRVFTKRDFGYVVIISFDCPSPEMDFFREKIMTADEEEKQLLRRIVTEGAATYSDRLNEIYLPQMHRRENPPIGSEQMIASALAQFLILMRRQGETEAVPPPSPIRSSEELCEQILDELNRSLYGNVRLDELESRLYFSKTSLKRQFRRKTGKSIIQYFLDMKLEESKKLIASGQYTFTQISEMLGFSSVHYFSRLFKNKTDMTPTQYAKSIKTENLI